jgi:hypothetical protein
LPNQARLCSSDTNKVISVKGSTKPIITLLKGPKAACCCDANIR